MTYLFKNWNKSPDNIDNFKNEMLVYKALYKKHKPTLTLWNQKTFTFNLDAKLQLWIEEKINIPCAKYGNKKAAFIVGEDIIAHMDVIDSFEQVESVINVKHFANKEKAINWLNSYELKLPNNKNTEVLFDGVDNNGNAVIKIISDSNDVLSTIKIIKELIEINNFKNNSANLYNTLTPREKQVLKLLAHKTGLKDISKKLNITYSTTQTHWKKIKRKLELTSIQDTILYKTS
jgi:DNA-binding CsgD family transcriptional regulator